MLDKKIVDILKPIKRRIYLGKLVNYIIFSMVVCSGISLIIMAISKFIPIIYVWGKIAIASSALSILGIAWSIYRRPSLEDTAKLVDGLGLQERVITSLELIGDSSKIALIQKEDTLSFLNRYNYKRKVEIKPPTKLLLVLLVLALSTALVGFIPSQAYHKAKEIEEGMEKAQEAIEQVEKVEEKIKKDKLMTQEEKQRIEEQLEKLKSSLKRPEELDELSKEMIKLEKKLEAIQEEMKERKIQEAVQKLSENEFSKELGEALMDRDSKKVADTFDKMADLIENMDKEKLESLADKLEKISEELMQNPELAEKLGELGDALIDRSNNSSSSVSGELNELQQAINELMSNPQVSGAISEMSGELKNIKSTIKSISNNNGNSQAGSSGSENDNGQQDGQGSNDGDQRNGGSSQSNGQGNSQGNQQGSGQGNGQGNQSPGGQGSSNQGQGHGSGSGAGNGTSNGDPGSGSDGSSGGGNKDLSQEEARDYEKIFAPEYIDGEGYDTDIHDDIDGDGDKDVIQVKRFGDTPGQSIPYEEVLRVYKENAYKNLDNQEIPANMKEIVKKYFSELE